ncbi:MAG: DUF6893 family small protein [Thermomicrobiales bacterium]
MRKRLFIGLLFAVAGAVAIQIPDIRRYMRIRSM